MDSATAIQVTTFVCSECGAEVERCDGCDKVFESDDNITCMDEQGHLCATCSGTLGDGTDA